MKTIHSELREEALNLEKIVQKAKKRLQTAPEGYLRISKKPDGIEYYLKSVQTGRNGRYMKKNEYEVAKAIAQRDYDAQVIKAAEERRKAINVFLQKYERANLKAIYNKFNLYRRELINPVVLSDEEYIKCWQEEAYEGKAFADDTPEIITERGESVRSKSEKIIADKLYALGIPYRYECPLILEGNIKLHPDFTILKMPDREEVYLEHLGMMDDSNYVENVIRKFNIYERNGIYIGVNLFITYETKKNPLNTRALDGLIKTLFCEDKS
ncbi:MAG: hypothetical protein IKK03_07225 [Lachnospiraceae bacterium]|nr:hypothetical protein [Lachnospiraceae bacterium]